jgi:hypothetical protein
MTKHSIAYTGLSSLAAEHMGTHQHAVGHSVVNLVRGCAPLTFNAAWQPCMDGHFPCRPIPVILRPLTAGNTPTDGVNAHCVCCAVATAMEQASGLTRHWGLCAWSMPGTTNAARASMLRSAMTNAISAEPWTAEDAMLLVYGRDLAAVLHVCQ